MVASDRISVYDVILPTEIPDKGKVLTQMSLFWFELTGDIVPNHFISEDVPPEAAGRGMRVQKLEMYPIECVVRGYLSGSGWREYRRPGPSAASSCPSGLKESDKLPEPIFTPATKAELGEHDENIDFDRAVEIIGDRPSDGGAAADLDRDLQAGRRPRGRAGDHRRRHQVRVRQLTGGGDRPRRRGPDPGLVAVLARRRLRAGRAPRPPSTSSTCATTPTRSAGTTPQPGPELPDEVVQNTRAKYVEAYEQITGPEARLVAAGLGR